MKQKREKDVISRGLILVGSIWKVDLQKQINSPSNKTQLSSVYDIFHGHKQDFILFPYFVKGEISSLKNDLVLKCIAVPLNTKTEKYIKSKLTQMMKNLIICSSLLFRIVFEIESKQWKNN